MVLLADAGSARSSTENTRSETGMSSTTEANSARRMLRQVRKWLHELQGEGALRIVAATIATKCGFPRGVDVNRVLRAHPEKSDCWQQPVVPTPTGGGKFPTIIFQTWKTRDALPLRYEYWSRSFRRHNPAWLYVRWDDADNRAFIARDFPWFLPWYDGYPREIFRADIVRLFFLFRFGGLYADLDTQCLRPLDCDVAQEGVTLGRISHDDAYDETYLNAMMASSPGQLFWLLAIAIAMEKYPGLAQASGKPMPELYTGPFIVTEAARFYLAADEAAVRHRAQPVITRLAADAPVRAGKLHVLAPERWCPIDWTNSLHNVFRVEVSRRQHLPTERYLRWIFPHSTLLTYWSHSWD